MELTAGMMGRSHRKVRAEYKRTGRGCEIDHAQEKQEKQEKQDREKGAALYETTPSVQNPSVEAGFSDTLWSLRTVPITPPRSET